MYKTFIGGVLLASVFAVASAEEARPTTMPASGIPYPVKVSTNKEGKPMMASGTPMKGEGTARPVMMGEDMQIPSTGDKALDSQIMSLKKEMDEKIKAIRMDYESKIKTLIGDKKPVWASSTQKMMPPKMMDGPGSAMWATSTDMKKRMENGSGTPMMMDGKRMPVRPTSLLQGFFRSLFGGTDAQAENR